MISTCCDYSFEKAQKVIYDECIKIMDSKAKFNMILSNGEYLIGFHSGDNHLHYVLRNSQSMGNRDIRLKDHDFENIVLNKGPNEKTVIVATEKLTEGEYWVEFSKGEFLVFKDGEIVFRNGLSVNSNEISNEVISRVNNIEVYDSPAWLDDKRADFRVIGVSSALRKKLRIEPGDKIIASNGLKKLELEVCKTDGRLLHGGACEADNPDLHVCMPRTIRDYLGLAEATSSRSSMQSFRKKFSEVSLENTKTN